LERENQQEYDARPAPSILQATGEIILSNFRRRSVSPFKLALCFVILLLSASLFAQGPDAVTRLKAGNARYVSNKLRSKNYAADRKATASGQQPYAIVLACADSRVPPEILFDESLGKLFVIRVAGNVVDPVVLGSIEYAAEHLHVGTLMILGHESCGAVKATLEGGDVPPNIKSLVTRITPAAEKAKRRGLDEAATLNLAIRENVMLQMEQTVEQSEVLKELVHEKKLRIVGGVYNLHSGAVHFLK
jgi:carbonic anhydrase